MKPITLQFWKWQIGIFRKEPNKIISYHEIRQTKHPVLGVDINFAFQIGERKYYQFADVSHMPAKRWSEWLLTFEEFEMGISKKWIQDYFLKETRKILNVKESLDVGKLSALVWDLDARTSLVMVEDRVYNLCACTFFELSEVMTGYDFTENKAKVSFWKKHSEPADFFLMKPIRELTGFTLDSKEAIQAFLKDQKIALALIARMSQSMSKQPSTK